MAEASVNIKVAEGEDRELVQTEIETLIHQSGWELVGDDTIRKTFYFKTYTKVLDFNNLIGKFSSATFEWTSYSPPGLSEKDVIMAKYCEEQAREIGDVKAQDAPSCHGPKTAKA
ncbi:hypothetical protein N7493_010602 [Penicillium malachiteum]|uniref:4a-hydroxytetrahydrobiopterin dehydratase n=1 Tax=Penicillium malachiteum TaxID=1324776 RepID=A0AAD6MRU2_9EURO|nr:hypothetical protein N7493_010602 [Penicillium malachiteum]